MASPRTVQSSLLMKCEAALEEAVAEIGAADHVEGRLQILEACASRFGGFSLSEFNAAFNIKPLATQSMVLGAAREVVEEIERCGVPYAKALSVLSQVRLSDQATKAAGAYHTDFRLADALAESLAIDLTHNSTVVDPACGTGMLLIAITERVCGHDRRKLNRWFKSKLFAADLSETSLRGALLSLASLTNRVDVLRDMRSNWLCGDSLLASDEIWRNMASTGFDGVIANPPWEKLKLSKHEFLLSSGSDRHYGSIVDDSDLGGYESRRGEVATYADEISDRYPMVRGGEPDLYIAFTELFGKLVSDTGTIAAIVPGGLIRSQGTEQIRQALFSSSKSLAITVFDNKARFFDIDTRFKFLFLVYSRSQPQQKVTRPIQLAFATADECGVHKLPAVRIGRGVLKKIRPDLTVPEVKSRHEWRLFSKMGRFSRTGQSPVDWSLDISREVDMSKSRNDFKKGKSRSRLPVIEGRMVHQFRCGVKSYVSGSGRRAVWRANRVGYENMSPQFWLDKHDVPAHSRSRVSVPRIGFCDIVGQTNERSMMASLIPPFTICGNKVPTIIFPNDDTGETTKVWLAVANSLAFDWYLRRVVTTTVNYFLLRSIPMPKLLRGGLPWRRLVELTHGLDDLVKTPRGENRLATHSALRAQIDAEVAFAYGLTSHDLLLIFQDFPLIDRRQPSLPGESRSTITRDMVLSAFESRNGNPHNLYGDRADLALGLGAYSHLPSDFSKVEQEASTSGGEVSTSGKSK